MRAVEIFEKELTTSELAAFHSLKNPAAIQELLDSIPYRPEDDNLCALSIFRDGKAHCFDGGLFAALALRRLGHRPVIVNMYPAPGTDDDHILAIYRHDGLFGAVAKSNFPGLRSREPVYRSIRELVMSYFEFYFNEYRQKTLRTYTTPLDLTHWDKYNWMTSNTHTQAIADLLSKRHRFELINCEMESRLTLVDQRLFKINMQDVNMDGLYKGEAKS